VSEPNDIPPPEAIRAHFEQVLPRIQRHAKIQFSYLTPEARDDAIAKALGLAWKYYLAEAEKGKKPDEYISAIATYAVKHVRAGRDVAGVEKAKDVMSKRVQREKGFSVQSIPDHDDPCEESETAEALRNWRETPPDEAAAFHHDFPMFVEELPEKQAAVVLDAAMGDTTTELAEKHQVSSSRVSQIRVEARKKWAELGTPPAERER
jgi:DNA-directed RNA polymerase specialized sigma24 family protein